MYCDYKISKIIDMGNQVEVHWRIYEGNYEERIINEIPIQTYVRYNTIYSGIDWFEKSPVLNDEINNTLKEFTQEIKGNREVIAECL